MANTVTALTAEIGKLLALLKEASQGPAAAKALINFLGWQLPPGLDDIGLAVIDFSRFLEKLRIVLESSDAELEDEILMAERIADLTVEMGNLVKQIQDLADQLPTKLAGFGDYVSRTNIHKEFPRRVLDLMVTAYLADRSFLLFSGFHLLNLLEFKHFEADEANYQVEHVRAIVHYDGLNSVLSDPS